MLGSILTLLSGEMKESNPELQGEVPGAVRCSGWVSSAVMLICVHLYVSVGEVSNETHRMVVFKQINCHI